jgi:hypothetical protein
MLVWYVKSMDGLLERANILCSAEPRCSLRDTQGLLKQLFNNILMIRMCIFNFSSSSVHIILSRWKSLIILFFIRCQNVVFLDKVCVLKGMFSFLHSKNTLLFFHEFRKNLCLFTSFPKILSF